MAHRYFTDQIQNGKASITGADAHHLSHVLRVKPGQILLLCDGAGTDYTAAVVSVDGQQVLLQIQSSSPSATEPRLSTTVYLGYSKGERMEWALQKCVELGAVRIVPVFSHKCVVKPKKEEEKNKRYTRIAHEAAKQSGRGILPQVSLPLTLLQALQDAAVTCQITLFLHEKASCSLRSVCQGLTSAALFTGPEGGFTSAELALAQENGAVPIGLGPRILRCETAPVAALSALMMLCGELE